MRALWRRAIPSSLMVVLLIITLNGCGEKEKTIYDLEGQGYRGVGGDGGEGNFKPLEAKGSATLTGTIKVNGPLPDNLPDIKAAMRQKDAQVCLSEMAPEEQKQQFAWVVGPDNALKNVAVFIMPEDPETTYFDLSEMVAENEDGKNFDKQRMVDQPYCAFVPHVQVVFPQYVTGGKGRIRAKYEPSGQQFLIKNSATIPHNTSYGGGSGFLPSGQVIPPEGMQDVTSAIAPDHRKPMGISCSIHPWMQCWVWVLPHPFADVTDDKGKFEIKNVPAGVPIKVFFWHEQKGFFAEETITLKDGESKTFDKSVNP